MELCNYVICYRRNGYNIITCSNNLAEAKRKFIDKLIQEDALRRAMEVNRALPTQPTTINSKPWVLRSVYKLLNKLLL